MRHAIILTFVLAFGGTAGNATAADSSGDASDDTEPRPAKSCSEAPCAYAIFAPMLGQNGKWPEIEVRKTKGPRKPRPIPGWGK